MIGNDIMNITTKQFPILTDVNLFWGFLADIYDREHGSGVAAPFFEYALQSSWMDQSYSFLDRLWLDGDRVVAFVFYEKIGYGKGIHWTFWKREELRTNDPSGKQTGSSSI